MATQQEVIKTFMQSLDNSTLNGAAAFNEAIKASSNFKSFKAVRTKFLADLKAAKNWHTFLVEKCGIILDNADTGAISGADAGGASVKGATDLLPSKGKAQYPEGSEFTINGMTLYGIPPKETLTEDEQYVVQGLYSWWIRDALALIKESYGLTFDEAGTTNSRLKLKFMDDENSDALAYVSYVDDGNRNVYEARVLCVNMAFFKNMDPDDHHGFVEKTGMNLDRTLVHELVHGLMASNVLGLENLPPSFVEGGTAELIHGIDDERYDNIVEYTKDPTVFEEYITADGFPYDDDYDAPEEIYATGYVFMRYFAKQAATTTFDYDTYHRTVSVDSLNFATNYHDTVTMRGSSNADTITNSGYNVTISAGKGKDVIKNYSDKVSVNGGNGKDTVFNEGSNVTIAGGKGKDSVENKGSYVMISGDAGKDYLSNDGSNVTINGGTGNDTISNSGSSVKINAGEDNDAISNYAASVTIDGGSGNDSFSNVGANSSVFGGADKDTIFNSATKVTINGGADNDSIQNRGTSSKIYGGTGNDIILNDLATLMGTIAGSKSTLYGGAGNDSITNAADSVKIYGQDGTDFITNSGKRVSIYGGASNDSVSNTASRVKIYGQDGADFITNSGNRVSIFGGADNDYIDNSGASISIGGDDGNDFITNTGKRVSVYGGAGNDSIISKGELSFISLSAGNDTFQNFANSISADGGSGRNRIINRGDSFTLTGGTGRDTIYNYGEGASLTSGNGNDYIFNGGIGVTSAGGAGNDYLRNEGVEAYILGGAGNDSIRNDSNHVTLSGGKGDDYLRNSGGKHITYRFGKNLGNDTVVGFNSSDTVQIISGKYSASTSGKNVVVKVGTATLTLKNAVGKKINFINSSGKTSTKTYKASTEALSLFEDDNFLTSNDLSALVKEKNVATSYVAELDSNFKELGMKNNLVTYSSSKK